MTKSKIQDFKAGAIVEIRFSDREKVFGRLLPGVASALAVYDLVVDQGKNCEVSELKKAPVLFYCGLYRDLVIKGVFPIVDFWDFTLMEIHKLPYIFFLQDKVNIDDCIVFGAGKEERKVTPEECIGLERSSVWDEQGILKRISDHYSGRRNPLVELDKVILSKNDPRYLPPPGALRWDFEKQEYYRTDK